MTLDAEAAAIIRHLDASAGRRYWLYSPGDARELTRVPREPVPDGITVTNSCARLAGRDVAIRVYRPHSHPQPPTVIFFHGGGWVLGDLDSYDGQVGRLVESSGCTWVSVDYRRAPEATFPAAFDDAYEATEWLLADETLGLNTQTWAVAGDSSGANLAAAVSLARRERGRSAANGMLLAYPVLDTETTSHSFTENDGYLLPADAMRWYLDLYVPDHRDRDDSRVAPLRAGDLTDLPPTIMIAAGFDVLRDQALRFANRLERAAVPVTLITERDLPHGFWALPISSSRRSLNETGVLLARIMQNSVGQDLADESANSAGTP